MKLSSRLFGIIVVLILSACGSPVTGSDLEPQPRINDGVYDILVHVTKDTCWGETGLRIGEWELRSLDGGTEEYELTFSNGDSVRSITDGDEILFIQELSETYTQDNETCEAVMTVSIGITPSEDDPDYFTGNGEVVIVSSCGDECHVNNSLSGRIQRSQDDDN